MHDPMVINLLWLLVPLVPAIAMFKWFPGDATASGPFMGLRWKLSGAVAGYFLILLISQNSFSKAADDARAVLQKQSDAALAEQKAQSDLARAEHTAKLAAEQAELGEPWIITGRIKKSDGSVVDNNTQFTTQPPDLNKRGDFFSYPILVPPQKPGDTNAALNISSPPYLPVLIFLPNKDEVTCESPNGTVTYRATRDPAKRTIKIDPTIVLEAPNADYKP